MVKLPEVSQGIPRVEAPTERHAARPTMGQIASPFADLARTMNTIGDTLSKDIAEPLAEEAGRNAVRAGPDGQLVVDRFPIIGAAGEKFSRAANMTYLARAQPRIETDMTKIRLEHPEDAEGFRKASDAYIQELSKSTPGQLRPSVLTSAGQAAEHNYRTVLVAAENRNVKDAESSYKSRLAELDNRMAALARQGGVDTPEYKTAQADAATLYGELRGDTRFKYPQERVDQELSEMASRHKGEAIIGNATRIHDKGTPTAAAEAKKWLSEAAWDPRLNLTPSQRHTIEVRGYQALEGRTAENKAFVDANRKLINETIEGLKTSIPYDEKHINDLKDRSLRLGDTESYYKLDAYQRFQPYRTAITGASLPDQIETFNQ